MHFLPRLRLDLMLLRQLELVLLLMPELELELALSVTHCHRRRCRVHSSCYLAVDLLCELALTKCIYWRSLLFIMCFDNNSIKVKKFIIIWTATEGERMGRRGRGRKRKREQTRPCQIQVNSAWFGFSFACCCCFLRGCFGAFSCQTALIFAF